MPRRARVHIRQSLSCVISQLHGIVILIYLELWFTKFSNRTALPMIYDLDYVNLGMDGVLIGR